MQHQSQTRKTNAAIFDYLSLVMNSLPSCLAFGYLLIIFQQKSNCIEAIKHLMDLNNEMKRKIGKIILALKVNPDCFGWSIKCLKI